MSKERYTEHTFAWELPNGDSVTKSNYNLADIETKYIPIQTEIISDNKDKTIAKLQQRIAALEEQLKNSIRPKFKIKQTVYRIYQDKIENGMISEIRVDEIGIIYHITMYKSKYCETYCYVNENDLFSTKAEAEAKLKEIKGENK